jgi:peptide/nickel transport system substrate-binding protein
VSDPTTPRNALENLAFNRRRLLAGAGGVALSGALAACGSSSSSSNTGSNGSGGSGGTPKRGGNFRLAVTGGGSKDMMDGQSIITKPDQARLLSAFETLLEYDDNYQLQHTGLAEEVTNDSPLQWTVRVRKGIEFQNGKTLGAEDVVYSLQRIVDAKNGLYGAAGLSSIDPNNIQTLDKYTVRLHLKSPNSTLADQFGQYYNGIVPVGYKAYPAPQYGTGPFVLKSFTPGSQSTHTRFKNYWRSPEPWFDTLTIIDFPSATAQVNALLAGQADAMTDIPFAQVNVAKSRGINVLVSKTGGWLPLCMRVDMPPFDNNDARQAMRLIADRPQIVTQVLSGYGTVANDLYSPFDPCFDHSLPQREQDIEQAKSLLKKAGMAGATFDLHTTNGAAGMVDLATVFANQASAAGITINVHNDPNYYGNQYLKLPFSVDFWGTRNYLAQVANGSIPTAPYNECHWPPKSGPGSNYISLYNQALSTTSESTRCDLIHEMQSLEYNYGGYVIPFFNDLVDAYAKNVAGFEPSKGTLNLDSFGHGFRTIWFT